VGFHPEQNRAQFDISKLKFILHLELVREGIIEQIQLVVIIGQLQNTVVNLGRFYNVLLFLFFSCDFLFYYLASLVLEFIKVLKSTFKGALLSGD
jgi:hypothetical protein